MTLSPGLREATLAVHLAASVGWVGSVVAYLTLGVAAINAADEATVRGAWLAMEIVGWYATVPLAVASLLTGLLVAAGTRWGLLRHYWVVISLLLTTFALVVLLLHMPTVSATVDLVMTASGTELRAFGGDVTHPSIGLVVLLTVLVLNVVKPRGLTSYGYRRQGERGGSPQ